jgi:hypothetical protein
MPCLVVAHAREQGVDLKIALLASDFGRNCPETPLAPLTLESSA